MYAAAARAPGLAFLARLHQVEVLRVVLVQNYVTVEDEDKRGREVIKRREAQVESLPPGRSRITSPYDTDARWSVKRDTFWNGYKVHITETCATSAAAGGGTAAGSDSGSDAHGDDGEAVAPPHLIVNVETTNAAVPDSQMTAPVHARLAGRDLLPAEHYVDSGYPSAELLVSSLATFGITLVTPMLADTSPQARAGAGFDRAAFAIDFDAGQATCPQGRTSSSWNPVTQRGPARSLSRSRRPPASPARSGPRGRASSSRSHRHSWSTLTVPGSMSMTRRECSVFGWPSTIRAPSPLTRVGEEPA